MLKRVCGLAIAAAMAVPALAQAGAATAAGGNIPTGMWVLNLARSKPIATPASQVLWIIKDDGRSMVWVAVITDSQGRVLVNSWDGAYGGAAAPVAGSAMTSQLASPGPGAIHNFGQIAGLGAYVEDCEVSEAGKRFVCHGKVATPDGPRQWLEDYDWAGPGPG